MNVRDVTVLAMALVVLFRSPTVAADEFFDIAQIESPGRSVAAELADLNGDGRADLLVVAFYGLPPEEQRSVRVHLQKPDGTLPARPDHTVALPPGSAVYDLADLRGGPGQELVLLRPDGVAVLSLADASGELWHVPTPGATTLALAEDERGFEVFPVVVRDFGPEPWLMVPGLGELLAFSLEGEIRARLEAPRRANYLVAPRRGLVSLESDFQVYFDAPKLSVGDVDGDGRADAVLSTRHEVWVYLRRPDGTFSASADRQLPLRLVTPQDHIRGSGGVVSLARDIDGDARLDLVVTHVQGSFTNAASTTTVYLNRDGQWRLDQPDQVLHSKASVDTNALVDLDADGRMELVRMRLRFGPLEVVELLLTREIDVQVLIHRFDAGRGFRERPWRKTEVELPFSFDTFRLKGFVPTIHVDFNADGYPDFVSSGGGDVLEISLGGGKPLSGPSYRQKLSTTGVIRFGDLEADGLTDFVIFDPHALDVPLRVGRNLGRLPGTPSARVNPR